MQEILIMNAMRNGTTTSQTDKLQPEFKQLRFLNRSFTLNLIQRVQLHNSHGDTIEYIPDNNSTANQFLHQNNECNFLQYYIRLKCQNNSK